MNSVAHTPWQESPAARIEEIAEQLRASGLSVTVRRNRVAKRVPRAVNSLLTCRRSSASSSGPPQRAFGRSERRRIKGGAFTNTTSAVWATWRG